MSLGSSDWEGKRCRIGRLLGVSGWGVAPGDARRAHLGRPGSSPVAPRSGSHFTAGTTPAGTESMRQSEKARRAHFVSAPAFCGFLPSVDGSFTPIFRSPSRPQLVRRAVRRNSRTPAKNPAKIPEVPVSGCLSAPPRATVRCMPLPGRKDQSRSAGRRESRRCWAAWAMVNPVKSQRSSEGNRVCPRCTARSGH